MESKRTTILLCGGSKGRAIIIGDVDSVPEAGKPAVMYDARMVLRWMGRRGVLGLAAAGPEEGSRITASVDMLVDTDWQQWFSVSDEVAAKIAEWPSC